MANERPRAGIEYPRTWPSFEAWLPDDAACCEYLARLRWPDGFVCPRCASGDFWTTGRGLWTCRSCSHQTSVTAGTIFHRSRYPLKTWFPAMWFVCSQKNGISTLGLQRAIGFGSYETAWAWIQKLRRAMVGPGARPGERAERYPFAVPVMTKPRILQTGLGRTRRSGRW
jgi:transposase-like protein